MQKFLPPPAGIDLNSYGYAAGLGATVLWINNTALQEKMNHTQIQNHNSSAAGGFNSCIRQHQETNKVSTVLCSKLQISCRRSRHADISPVWEKYN